MQAPVRHRRKEARPSELTAAALDLFVEKGFAATRLDEIAARAGVSKGTLYLYFDSKEALFEAVIVDGVVPLIEAGEALVNASPSDRAAMSLQGAQSELAQIVARVGLAPGASYLQFGVSDAAGDQTLEREHHERLLRAILFGWWDRIGSTRLGGIPKLMMAEAANFPKVAEYFNEQVIRRGHAVVAAVLASGIERGVFRDIDLEHTVPLFLAPGIHLAMCLRSPAFCGQTGANPQDFLENYFQIFLRGIRA